MREERKIVGSFLAHFSGHVAIGVILFVVVGAPAVGLSLLVRFLEGYGIDGFTVSVLVFLEHAILVADASLFLIYLAATAYSFIKEMWKP